MELLGTLLSNRGRWPWLPSKTDTRRTKIWQSRLFICYIQQAQIVNHLSRHHIIVVSDSEQYIIADSNLYLFQSPMVRNWVTHYIKDLTERCEVRHEWVLAETLSIRQTFRTRRQRNYPFVLRCTCYYVSIAILFRQKQLHNPFIHLYVPVSSFIIYPYNYLWNVLFNWSYEINWKSFVMHFLLFLSNRLNPCVTLIGNFYLLNLPLWANFYNYTDLSHTTSTSTTTTTFRPTNPIGWPQPQPSTRLAQQHRLRRVEAKVEAEVEAGWGKLRPSQLSWILLDDLNGGWGKVEAGWGRLRHAFWAGIQ